MMRDEYEKRVRLWQREGSEDWVQTGEGTLSWEEQDRLEVLSLATRLPLLSHSLSQGRHYNLHPSSCGQLVSWLHLPTNTHLAISSLDERLSPLLWHWLSPRLVWPPPSVATLQAILDDSTYCLESLVSHILSSQEYLSLLQGVLGELEETLAQESLGLMYHLMCNLLTSKSEPLLLLLLSPKHYSLLLGALEYGEPRQPYRAYLRHNLFNNCLSIEDTTVIAMISDSHRYTFFKECVAPISLGETQVSSLNALITTNNQHILTFLCHHPHLFPPLLALPVTHYRDVLLLFYELMALLRDYSDQRGTLLHSIQDHLSILLDKMFLYLDTQGEGLLTKGLEILSQLVTSLRSEMMECLGSSGLVAFLEKTLSHEDMAIQMACCQIVKQFLTGEDSSINR